MRFQRCAFSGAPPVPATIFILRSPRIKQNIKRFFRRRRGRLPSCSSIPPPPHAAVVCLALTTQDNMPHRLEVRRLRNASVRDLPPAARERFTLATSLRRYAANLCLRAVHNETRQHAKAVLAEVYQVAVLDHMGEERQNPSLPLLRMASGKEIQVRYPRDASLHDFYQICRNLLQLRPNESLALLRAGHGTLPQRLLHCSRACHAARWVKGMVFGVVVHK